ncbi:MAG: type II secretion system protein [Patescibacteria group bacterium]|nr:type II secretion system protein [Patescibacteria group bacterium]
MLKQKNTFNIEAGFTLIEILVVVSIIGILASIALIGVDDARKKARDARRVSDLYQISQAVEMYNNASGQYPENLASNLSSYFPKGLPVDPNPSKNYDYIRDGSKCYILRATLDRNNKDVLKRDLDNEVNCGVTLDCSDDSFYYCIGNNQ